MRLLVVCALLSACTHQSAVATYTRGIRGETRGRAIDHVNGADSATPSSVLEAFRLSVQGSEHNNESLRGEVGLELAFRDFSSDLSIVKAGVSTGGSFAPILAEGSDWAFRPIVHGLVGTGLSRLRTGPVDIDGDYQFAELSGGMLLEFGRRPKPRRDSVLGLRLTAGYRWENHRLDDNASELDLRAQGLIIGAAIELSF